MPGFQTQNLKTWHTTYNRHISRRINGHIFLVTIHVCIEFIDMFFLENKNRHMIANEYVYGRPWDYLLTFALSVAGILFCEAIATNNTTVPPNKHTSDHPSQLSTNLLGSPCSARTRRGLSQKTALQAYLVHPMYFISTSSTCAGIQAADKPLFWDFVLSLRP